MLKRHQSKRKWAKNLPFQILASLLIAYIILWAITQIEIHLGGGKYCESRECVIDSFTSVISIGNVEAYSILTLAILYIFDSGERRKKKQYEAWAIVNSANQNSVSGGRVSALQDLREDNVSLAGISLPGTYLRGINLSDTELSGGNFSNASLEEAKFNNSTLQDSKFIDAKLSYASFSHAWLRNADFSGAKLFGSKFDHVYAECSVFRATETGKTDLDGVSFKKAWLAKADFTQASLWKADLTDANLVGSIFINANLKEAKFNNEIGRFRYGKSYYITFWKARIRISAKMYEFHEEHSIEKYISWTKIKFVENSFYVIGQSLEKADFRDACLCQAELKKADLVGAIFAGAHLQGAVLNGANLEGADLSNADLSSASFLGAKNLTVSQIKLARNWQKAKFDTLFQMEITLDSIAKCLDSITKKYMH